MTNRDELKELQRPDTWEDGDDEIRPEVKAPRAVVSVAFAREDFDRVVDHARHHGMKTSEFIRQAALEQTDVKRNRAIIVSVSGNVRTPYPPESGPLTKVKVTATSESRDFATA